MQNLIAVCRTVPDSIALLACPFVLFGFFFVFCKTSQQSLTLRHLNQFVKNDDDDDDTVYHSYGIGIMPDPLKHALPTRYHAEFGLV